MNIPLTQRLRGTGVALITPFTEDDRLDFEALAQLLDYQSREGIDFLVVQGTTGEAVTTTPDEKKEVLAFVKAHNPRELPIVYGIGGPSTANVLTAIADTDFAGVDVLLSVTPYYNGPSQAGLEAHFRAVADASPVPVMLYNVPGRTACNLEAATTLRLATHPNIIGIKEAHPGIAQSLQLAAERPEGFLLLSGNDMMTLPMISFGAEGVISVMANALPGPFSQMVRFALDEQYGEARRLLHALLPLDALMYAECNPVGVKAALALQGIGNGRVRLPLVAASPGLRAQLAAGLETLSDLKLASSLPPH